MLLLNCVHNILFNFCQTRYNVNLNDDHQCLRFNCLLAAFPGLRKLSYFISAQFGLN